MNDQSLDNLLVDWSRRNSPDEAALQTLAIRVLSQAQVLPQTQGDPAGTSEPSVVTVRVAQGVPASSYSARMVVTLLTLVMVALSGFFIAVPRMPSVVDCSLSQQKVTGHETQQRLFVELNELFPGQWRWSSEVNGRVRLELAEHERLDDAGDDGVIVQIAVIRRSGRDQAWRPLWEATVLSRTGEWVHLPDELTGNNRLSVWTCALPDGGLLVENSVALQSPVPVTVSEPCVYLQSNTACLWSGRNSDGEYQLIQSVTRTGETHAG